MASRPGNFYKALFVFTQLTLFPNAKHCFRQSLMRYFDNCLTLNIFNRSMGSFNCICGGNSVETSPRGNGRLPSAEGYTSGVLRELVGRR